MYGQEHEDDAGDWIGKANGEGWPIFKDPKTAPKFRDLTWEPRTALHNFHDIKTRAVKKIKQWNEYLAASRASGHREAVVEDKLRRIARAVRWWSHFLAVHEQEFGGGGGGRRPIFAVDEGSCLRIDSLLPQPAQQPAVTAGPSAEQAQRAPFVPR